VEILITPSKYIRIGGLRINKRYLGILIATLLTIPFLFAVNSIRLAEMENLLYSISTIISTVIGWSLDFFALIRKPKPTVAVDIDATQIQEAISQNLPLIIQDITGNVSVSINYLSKNYEGDEGYVKN
jgi:hypothetical protein